LSGKQEEDDEMPERRISFSGRSRRKNNLSFPLFILLALVLGAFFLLSKYNHKPPRFNHALRNTFSANPVSGDSLQTADTSELELELPAIKPNDEIVRHYAYTLCFSDADKEPKWVAYVLKAGYIGWHEKRPDDFRPDPLVVTGSATSQDYTSSGYDRGHQMPAADMKWSKRAEEEAFYMSNICPQLHGFNAGIWEDLEDAVRGMALRDGKLYVIVGPVLGSNLKKIGADGVSVPKYFYKVILDTHAAGSQPVSAFIIPNQDLKQPFWDYSVSLDSVEKVTGIRFFPKLRSKIQSTENIAAPPSIWQSVQ